MELVEHHVQFWAVVLAVLELGVVPPDVVSLMVDLTVRASGVSFS
jgi:hypothetical protein